MKIDRARGGGGGGREHHLLAQCIHGRGGDRHITGSATEYDDLCIWSGTAVIHEAIVPHHTLSVRDEERSRKLRIRQQAH
ncbi:MAG: hypothetical protein ACO3SO_08420, partial [Luteolibacter sp.]